MHDNIYDGFCDAVSPFDAEAEPEDLAAMEQKLSETTEDTGKLTADEQDELCGEGLQEPSGYPPEGGCCDNTPEILEEDETERIAREMEELCLAEPEPPEED